ncbi:MAG: chloride channel protein [Crocinitomicaceae bacterium]|nr:chloride channel protein [Crocinitomicaceae bacterium]
MTQREKIVFSSYLKLILASAFIGLLCSLLAISFKFITEYAEHSIIHLVNITTSFLYIFLPSIGISIIYFLRKFFFQNKKNKGITEIYKTLDDRKEHLPFYKVPSHYLNGFFTVIFGGSTGIEVSTVVATAALGNNIYKKNLVAHIYKREIVCAGVAAGIAILFSSPLAGWLFAIEVIARKISKTVIISCTASVAVASLYIFFIDDSRILPFELTHWNWFAVPFFIILSCIGGALSAYFTFLVTRMKPLFSRFPNDFYRVFVGALIVGILLFFFPQLYGDSYKGLHDVISNSMEIGGISLIILFFLAILKPLAAAITLGAGGDGGVFAPSIVAGAFLGILFAQVCNSLFDTQLILLNFALIGAASMLSASIAAPLTTIILISNIIPNGYVLVVPLTLCCFIAVAFAKRILPYTVYTYHTYEKEQKVK